MPVRITFEADSSDELLDMVRRWALGSGSAVLAEPEGRAGSPEGRPADAGTFRELVRGVRGEGSRRLLRDVAEASACGEPVASDAALLERYGRSKPVAFSGIVSGSNRRWKSLTGRTLISRGDDGYRMDRDDATGVIDAFAADDARSRE